MLTPWECLSAGPVALIVVMFGMLGACVFAIGLMTIYGFVPESWRGKK
jgi:hypothetical protein